MSSTDILGMMGSAGSSGSQGSQGGGLDAVSRIKLLTLRSLGGESLPNEISIYPVSFESKDRVTSYLDDWNDLDNDVYIGADRYEGERTSITYTDALEIIISVINTMIDVVSYALIAFTSISLVVSTVMIGIITYVSVVERIKEIGVIRSLGGRKRDV